ncbi:nuclear transport factor 2 family protein [Variovorax paradoxus]|uniref:nuclear transport factor 2 family protein n=1 Tax=Variovorax paradoxus TaxID=34073 RepID=UPI0009BAC4F4|nr:nuclear transport factor 2 family protein [Variovorax paradoxus]
MEQQTSDMACSRDAYEGVFALVDVYFQSIYTGNAEALRSTFDPKCRLFADVDGSRYEKSVDEYVQGVANRKSPRGLGEPFRMQAIGVEVLGAIALVRTRQLMLGFDYRDYLTLVRRDGQWLIASKTFVNVASAESSASPAR